MNSDFKGSKDSERLPTVYGRKQFEREAGVDNVDEEYAGELAPPAGGIAPRSAPVRRAEENDPIADLGTFVQDEGDVVAQNKSLGIIALVLAAISLFFLPAILGPAAMVVGFAAYVRGSRTLGVWSMALGLIAVAAYYVLVPYYT